MKRLIVPGLMLISSTCFAADPQMQMMGMDPAKMQQMQKAMIELKNCMQKINKDDIEKLKTRGHAMEQEIKSLCKTGNRSEAQNKALAYSKEIMHAPEMVQMQKCSEKIRDIIPNAMDAEKYSSEKLKKENVCDEINKANN